MKRNRLGIAGVALLVLVLGAVVIGGSESHGSPSKGKAAREAGGLVSASAERGDREARARTAQAARSFGPNVLSGRFDGVSPDVSSLPVLPIQPVTSIKPRDNESLLPAGQSNAKDPVVQKRKGTGPISAPIQNFDGMCLPFGNDPCAQASNCSCLPPDTNGEAGLTQYVEMVNTSFAVYSKTGGVVRPATELNQLWASAGGECSTHNDGDPVASEQPDLLTRLHILTEPHVLGALRIVFGCLRLFAKLNGPK